MKVSEQCEIEASKGNQIVGIIRRNDTVQEKELIILLEYLLERVRRRATKMIEKLLVMVCV